MMNSPGECSEYVEVIVPLLNQSNQIRDIVLRLKRKIILYLTRGKSNPGNFINIAMIFVKESSLSNSW